MEYIVSTITVRELPEDLQEFLKADAVANHRSLNKQVIVALDEYRRMRQPSLRPHETPQEKMAAVQRLLDEACPKIIRDQRTDDEIIGYNQHGHFG